MTTLRRSGVCHRLAAEGCVLVEDGIGALFDVLRYT
jgi:hypothetical protein